jgi:hypothetical protein
MCYFSAEILYLCRLSFRLDVAGCPFLNNVYLEKIPAWLSQDLNRSVLSDIPHRYRVLDETDLTRILADCYILKYISARTVGRLGMIMSMML